MRITGLGIVAAALLVGLGVSARPALAHKVAVGVVSTTVDNTLDSISWKILLSYTFTLLNHNHSCVATATSDVFSDELGFTLDHYLFVLTLGDTDPDLDTGAQRELHFEDDLAWLPVSSTFGWTELAPGTYTVYWLGRKNATDATNGIVLDSSLTVTCARKLLQ
jgi:hypothetical protein